MLLMVEKPSIVWVSATGDVPWCHDQYLIATKGHRRYVNYSNVDGLTVLFTRGSHLLQHSMGCTLKRALGSFLLR